MTKARREMFEEQLRALQDDITTLSMKLATSHAPTQQKPASPARKSAKKGMALIRLL